MGTFSLSNFGNDAAADWLDLFSQRKSLKKLLLQAQSSAFGALEETLVASEILAAINGHPSSDFPFEMLSWCRTQQSKLRKEDLSKVADNLAYLLKSPEVTHRFRDIEDCSTFVISQQNLLFRLQSSQIPLTIEPTPQIVVASENGSEEQALNWKNELPNLRKKIGHVEKVDIVAVKGAATLSDKDWKRIADWLDQYNFRQLTLIEHPSKKIKTFSLSMLQFFPELETLVIKSTHLQDLSPLANLKELKYLFIARISEPKAEAAYLAQLERLKLALPHLHASLVVVHPLAVVLKV